MNIQINYQSGAPVYQQIAEQVKYASASGSLQSGNPLPGIRPLAELLRVNRNTVAKAYTELENQGVVESRPGKGCFLVENQTPYKKQVRLRLLTGSIDAAIVQAHHFQISKDYFLKLAERRFRDFDRMNAKNKGQS